MYVNIIMLFLISRLMSMINLMQIDPDVQLTFYSFQVHYWLHALYVDCLHH